MGAIYRVLNGGAAAGRKKEKMNTKRTKLRADRCFEDLPTRIDALNHEVARFWQEQGRAGNPHVFSVLDDVEVAPWQ
jgi:hypothetical protein